MPLESNKDVPPVVGSAAIDDSDDVHSEGEGQLYSASASESGCNSPDASMSSNGDSIILNNEDEGESDTAGDKEESQVEVDLFCSL